MRISFEERLPDIHIHDFSYNGIHFLNQTSYQYMKGALKKNLKLTKDIEEWNVEFIQEDGRPVKGADILYLEQMEVNYFRQKAVEKILIDRLNARVEGNPDYFEKYRRIHELLLQLLTEEDIVQVLPDYEFEFSPESLTFQDLMKVLPYELFFKKEHLTQNARVLKENAIHLFLESGLKGKVIVLDHPETGLTYEEKLQFVRFLKQTGATIIVITNDFHFLQGVEQSSQLHVIDRYNELIDMEQVIIEQEAHFGKKTDLLAKNLAFLLGVVSFHSPEEHDLFKDLMSQ